MKKDLLIVLALLFLGTNFVYAGDQEERDLLSRYGERGLILSEKKVHPAYPSEKEIVINLAKEMKNKGILIPAPYEMNEHTHFENYRIGKPVEVTQIKTGSRFDLYYFIIPIIHPDEGLRMEVRYDRHRDIRNKDGEIDLNLNTYHVGYSERRDFNPEPPHYPAAHLITEPEAAQLIEKYFNVKVKNKVRAVSGFSPEPRVPSPWLWYTRIDEGFTYQGRMMNSVFINPYAIVHDARKVGLEDLARKESVGRLAGALIRDRFYTFSGKDIDVYRLEREIREIDPDMVGGKTRSSEWLSQDDIGLIPLVPENQPPDTGDLKEPTAVERMRKVGGGQNLKEQLEKGRTKSGQ